MSLLPLKEFDFDRYPMICAHRGDTSLGAADNTIEAVRAALGSGAEMIEVDIQFTDAGEIVCNHDEINGGERYERFEDIISLVAGKVYLNIELKGYGAINELPLLPTLFEIVSKYGMSDCVLYSSFRPDYIKEISKQAIATIIHPTSEMSALFGGENIVNMLPSDLIAATGASTYAAQLSELDERRVSDIKSHTIHLSVYTINTQVEFNKSIEIGAKAVVTDRPRKLVQYRKEKFSI